MASHYVRTRDDDENIIDDVRICIVPRYKTSEMSGDEWRVSAMVELRRKDDLMCTRRYGSVEAAVAHLPWLLMTWSEDEEGTHDPELRGLVSWSDKIDKDHETCHQCGCAEPATVVYKLKQTYCNDGKPHDIKYGDKLRAFCNRHSKRGDCGLEDADINYESISGSITEPEETDKTQSGCVAVSVGSIEELPAAIRKVRKDMKQ